METVTETKIVKKPMSYSDLGKEIQSENVYEVDIIKTENSLTIQEHFSTGEVWAFIILSIIVIIACFFIAYNEQDWFSDLKKIDWAENSIAWGIAFIIVYLVMTLCSSFAYMRGNNDSKLGIFITFIISSALLIVWFALFYKSKDLNSAFYASVALIIVALIQTYYVWRSDLGSGIGMLPYVIFLLFLSGVNWNISSLNIV